MNALIHNKSSADYTENQVLQEPTAMNLKLLKFLVIEIKKEIDNINQTGQIDLGRGINLSEQVQKFEANMIRHALYLCQGRQAEAARMLGIQKTTLHAKLKRYHMTV